MSFHFAGGSFISSWRWPYRATPPSSRAAQRAGTSQRPGTECRQQKIESLAQQRRWHDYRYTFKSTFPRRLRPPRPVLKHPALPDFAWGHRPQPDELHRQLPTSWQMNVAVRPDVLVPVVMANHWLPAIRHSPRMMWS